MDVLYLIFLACLLFVIFLLSLRYLSLLRWFSGQAYVMSKKQTSFTILEVLELLKNAKPFPVSYQKGWKIHRFVHNHRVWFQYLTFTRVSSAGSSKDAPCIKVFATFDRVRASAQSLLQLVKDTSLSCEWKPGVIAARSVHEVPASEVNGRGVGKASSPVLNDFVRVESVQSPEWSLWSWLRTNSNVTPTIIQDYKRFWHKEDNGCSWLLQMNEDAQSLVFFLIQPVEEPDHSLLTVITWSGPHAYPVIAADEAPSVLLSSLSEYIHLRRVHMTPLLHISVPQHMANTTPPTTPTLLPNTTEKPASQPQDTFFSRFRTFMGQGSSDPEKKAGPEPISETAKKKSASILHFRGSGFSRKRPTLARGRKAEQHQVIEEEENESEDFGAGKVSLPAECSSAEANGTLGSGGDTCESSALRRSVSDGGASLGLAPGDVAVAPLAPSADNTVTRYRTMINQAAADIMAEALRISNIDLETSAADQAEASNGWTFLGFDTNIVVLKKVPQSGSTMQSYLGKGFILAPPKTVWDAIRNPRTRFTYDDSLKRVDIIEQVTEGLKIVYLYQEVQQLIRKECCDLCCLQGERVEGSKFMLAYTSVNHCSVPVNDNIFRAKMMSSGWIVEPVQKGQNVYSLVTYLMQVDYGSARAAMEEVMSRQPLAISYLQQYLKPAVQLARRNSAPIIPVA